VHHASALGTARFERSAPALRGGTPQHLARPRSDLAQLIESLPDARAAAGRLPPGNAAVVRRSRRCHLGAHARPIHLEFLGHEHRHRGVDALPHLGFCDQDRHGIVGRDAQPRVDRRRLTLFRRRLGEALTQRPQRQMEAEHQTTGGAPAQLEKTPPRDCVSTAHDLARCLISSAAR
jgi:hypothetical protein